ncbi:TPM domain-containing protein [Permianibacter sp. IMCC34836]|uniref:TPM domain-containing protein n=1 Tax=Permianibacter fluminis TaxID=2738515 RepID=UPI001553CE7D|nr:TPM domain-containing protein [Permianibacter fluminis]NQD37314.1 TPM domain-containing protein [Permianibacter fluminis]
MLKSWLWLFAAVSMAALAADELPVPLDNYLNDYAVLLTEAEQAELREQGRQLEASTGVELSVVLIDRIGDYSEDTNIERFATRLFDSWGVGNTELNDGILLLVARDDRAVRIELGAGYGHDHDSEMQRIVDELLVPAFRQSRYFDGLQAGSGALVQFAEDWAALRANDSWWLRAWLKFKAGMRSLWAKLALPAGAGGIGWQWFRRWRRHQARQCRQCQAAMVRLSEVADDRYLEAGQKTEERVGSVDYDVWKCTRCAAYHVIDYPSLLTRFHRCDGCGRRTSQQQSRSVIGNQVTTTFRCRHCQHIQQTFSTVRESTSGASAGFGGGSSGGGGATGRW